jgi:hypothetical protein
MNLAKIYFFMKRGSKFTLIQEKIVLAIQNLFLRAFLGQKLHLLSVESASILANSRLR